MKKTWLSIAALPLAAAPLLWAQEAKPAQEVPARSDAATQAKRNGLSRVQRGERDDEREAFDREAWTSKLENGDLEQRERDFERLIELARRNGDVRDALESWAKDASHPELAWTSRVALRDLDRDRRRTSFAPFGGSPDRFDLHTRFDDLQRQFGDVDSMFSKLQAELDELFRDDDPFGVPGVLTPLPEAQGGQGRSARSQAQSFTLQSGPDGVTCEVTEEVDGEKKTREYTADSVEELLEANPELRDKIQIGASHAPGSPGSIGQGLRGQGLFRSRPIPIPRLGQPFSGTPPTDMLGVEVTKPSAERVDELGLQSGLGLHVDRTVPGTIAEILGIRRGDVLVEVNGAPIHGRADIAAALRERPAAEPLALVLIDASGQRRTLTWNPSETNHARDSKDEAQGNEAQGSARKF